MSPQRPRAKLASRSSSRSVLPQVSRWHSSSLSQRLFNCTGAACRTHDGETTPPSGGNNMGAEPRSACDDRAEKVASLAKRVRFSGDLPHGRYWSHGRLSASSALLLPIVSYKPFARAPLIDGIRYARASAEPLARWRRLTALF